MSELKRDESGIAHIVGLSGGKDSTCLAILLAEEEPRPYNYVCTPTGNELPPMLDHWRKLEELLGQPLLMLKAPTLMDVIEKQGALPSWRMRFCTRIIKLAPYGRFIQAAQPAVSYIGLRDDEEDRDGASHGGDFVPKESGLVQRFPLRERGYDIDMVYKFLSDRNITIPDRTDCAWCYYQKIGEWYNLWAQHPVTYSQGEALEVRYGHTFRSAKRDSWPASLAELRLEFEKGRKPERSLKMMDSRTNMCRACTL